MRSQFLIFFSVAILIYFGMNLYVCWRGYACLPAKPTVRSIYLIIMTLLSLAYIAGRLIENLTQSTICNIVVWIGSIWLGVLVYSLLLFISIDIVRLVSYLIGHKAILQYNTQTGTAVSIIIAILVLVGWCNARFPRTKVINLPTKKITQTFRIAMASDIHLGAIIGPHRCRELVNAIEEAKPDLIVFAGDVIDEDVKIVMKRNTGEALRNLHAPYGVYAIPGNHEYIGGINQAVQYLQAHGIHMLMDETVQVGPVELIGRKDLSSERFGHESRKSLQDLVEATDSTRYRILLDHQPADLKPAVRERLDLQLSGHTHHGQLFPFSLITAKIYEVSWGLKKIKDTNVYVSCGYGTWGPPLRIGNRPEVVIINLYPQK